MSSHLPTSRDFSRGFIRLFCGLLFTIGVLFNSNSQTCGGSITSNVTFTGNITCSSGIVIDANNITIDGGGYTIYMSSSSSAIQMHGKTGVTIKNLNVVYTSSPGISLYVSNSSGCTIENNDFSNASTALRFDGSNSTNTIDNNNMSDAASIALHFTNGNNQGNIITNNQIKSDTHYGIYYNYGTPGEIHNNDLTNSLNGIFLSGATNFSFTSPSSAGPNKNIYGGHTSNVLYYQSANGGTIEDWDMSSLITDPTGQIALSVNSVRNMVIQNNDFTGGFSTALRLDGSNSTNTIDNNNMSDAASIALHFTNGNNQGNIITNNQIKSDTHYGIYYNYGTPGEIHNNDLTNSLNGIFLSGATNFSFTSPSSAGPNKNIYGGHTSNVLYYQSSNGGTIEDWDMSSLITDPTGQIALSVNSVRNMVIQNNDFTGGFSTALRLDGSNSTNTIDNNNMSDAASIALHFTNGNNQGNIITNNQIKSDTHYGIYYNYGTPGEIHNNDLTNSLNGIFLSGATNFSFTSPSSAGPNKNIYGGHTSNVLYYQSSNGGTIEDWDMSSLITDPTGQIALSVNSVRNMVIQNNDFTGGFSTALRLDGSNSTNTIDNNNMSDAASIALHFTNGNNQGNIITNNQIKSDTHYGIYYNYGTPGEIHNNDLTNSLNGIFLSGATNFSFTSPSSAGPNKNIYGGHTSNVLYYQSANGGTIEDWDMSSLITDPTGQIALSVNSVRNMVIQNNDFTGGFSTALRLDGSNSTNTIDNNNMSDAASIALHFTNGNNQGNIITNNQIKSDTHYGIYYNYGTPGEIHNNDLTNSLNGIFLSGATNFSFTSPSSAGPNKNIYGGHTSNVLYYQSANGGTIEDWDMSSLITDPTGQIALSVNSVRNMVIQNNDFTGGFSTALRLDGSNSTNTIDNNNMSDAASIALHFTNGNNQGNIITSNDITNANGFGIYYNYGTPSDISNNDLTGSGSGIYLSSPSNYTVGVNTLEDIGNIVVTILRGNNVTIQDINVSGAGGTGIQLITTNNSIVKNIESCGRDAAIDIRSDYGVSQNNQFIDNKIATSANGVLIRNNVHNTIVANTQFSGNATDVHDLGSNTTISGSSEVSAIWCPFVDEDGPSIVTMDIDVELDPNGIAIITSDMLDFGTTDTSGVASFEVLPLTFDCSNLGNNLVTITATDNLGNVSTTTSNVTILDVTSPTVLVQDVIVELDANGQASITPQDVDTGSADNCGNVTLSLDRTDFDCGDIGFVSAAEITFIGQSSRSTNQHGGAYNPNTDEYWFPVWASSTVRVYDANNVLLRSFNAGVDQMMGMWIDTQSNDYYTANWANNTVTRRNGNTAIWSYNMGAVAAAVTADDNYVYAIGSRKSEVVVLDKTTGQFVRNITLPGVFDVSGGMVQANGNLYIGGSANGGTTINGTYKAIHVIEISTGTYLNSAPTAALVYNGFFDGEVFWISPKTNAIFGYKISDGNSFTGGGTGKVVTLTATDASNNSSTATANVTVVDDTPPIAIAQDVTVYLDASGNASITSADIDGGSTDNCGNVTLSLDQTNFDCGDVGGNSYAIDMSNSNGVISVLDNQSLNPTEITLEAWVYSSNWSGQQHPMIISKGVNQEYILWKSNDGGAANEKFAMRLGGTTVYGTTTVQNDTWYHVAGTYDATNGARIYVNGILETAVGYAGAIINGANPVGIGAGYYGSNTGNHFNGIIDEVRIWNKSLSASEIAARFNQRISISDVLYNNLVLYFPFDVGSGSNAIDHSALGNDGAFNNIDVSTAWITPDAFGATGGNEVTLTVTDPSGNTTSVSATVTVEDNIAPTMATNSIAVALVDRDAYILSQTEIDELGENSTDNCSLAFTISDYEIDCSTIGQTLDLTLTGTDPSGNSNSVQVSVVVSDPNSVCNEPPLAVCEDITISVNENCEASITAADVDGGSSDPDGDQLTYTVDNEGPFGVGPHSVTLTVTDPDGETSQCSATVTVVDLAAPTIQSLNASLALDENGGLTITYEDIANIDENCTLGEVTLSQSEFDCDDLGEQIVTITAIDESGGGPTGNFITTTGVLNGTQRTNMVTGDVDGDGLIDVLLTNNFYRNLGNGNFGLQFLGNSGGENAGQLGDIDGDGDLDAITGSFVYKWNGSSMQYAQALSTSPVFNQSVLVDIDNDGDLDYYKPTYYSVPDELYKNDGNGNFTLFAQNAVGSYQMDADHADLDGDGDQDLVVAGYYDVRVAENDGNGNLTYTSIYSNGNDYINAVYIRDMNGDGVFDIVLSPCCAPPFILYGLGGNTYGSPTSLQATFTGGGYDMAVGDVDADGDIDIAVTTYNNPIVVFENDGIGNFTENITSISGNYHDVVIADFNNDGVNDMAASQWGPGALMLSEVSLGNSTTTDVTVTIVDDIPPTAIAQDITVTLDANGQATITSEDIDNGSNDNCGNVTLSLDRTNFDCSDIQGSVVSQYALNLSSPNDYVSLGNVLNFDRLDAFSIEVWFKTTDADAAIVSKLERYNIGPDKYAGYEFALAGGKLRFHLNSDQQDALQTDRVEIRTNSSFNDGSWHHAIATYDGSSQASGLRIFVDGNLQSSTTFKNALTNSITNNQSVSIGTRFTNGGQYIDYNGIIDGLKFYGLDLNAVQVSGSYNGILPTGLIAAFDVEEGFGSVISPGQGQNLIGNIMNANTGLVWSTDAAPTSSQQSGSLVTLTVTDVNGNVSTETATVTVNDVTSPIVVTQDISIDLGANGNASITAGDIDNGSSDACGIASISVNQTDFDCSHVGANTVTLTVTDVNGNASTATAAVTVNDVTDPVAVTQNISIDLDAAGNASITAGDIDNGSSDACGIASLSVDQSNFDCSHVGANTVTLTVTDVNGNASTATATVTVNDVTDPLAVTQNISIDLDAAGNASITAGDIDNGSSDACGIASISVNQTDFDCSHVGANTVTLTVTDVNGNASTATATVTVNDVTGPVAVTQNISIDLDAAGNASITAGDIDNGSSDACGIASISVNQTDFDCSHVGANTVTLTVTDVNGNASTATATVTVNDVTDPEAVTQNISIDLDAAGNASITAGDIDNGSSDVCGIASLSVDQSNFDCSHVGANTVTLTVTDVNGNASTATATVTVNDVTDPLAVTQNISIDLDAAGNASITAGDIDNGSSDACGIASIYVNQTDFDCSHVGVNTVTLSVTDVNGNASIATATVTVNDMTGPVAVTQNISIDLDAEGNASITAGDIDNGSSDACGIASISVNQTDFDCSHVGVNTVTLTVTDVNGNASTATAAVTVNDVTDPAISGMPSNIVVTAPDTNCELPVSWTEPSASDNCSSVLSSSHASGDIFSVGTTTVTYTATDPSGNAVSASFDVTVEALPMSLSLSSDLIDVGNVSCYGASDGAITSNVGGGCAPYAYTWSNGASTSDVSGVAAGTYTLTVYDSNGSSISESITLTEPDPLEAGIATPATTNDATCAFPDANLIFGYPGSNVTSVTLNASAVGGNDDYTYSWSPSVGLDNPYSASPVFSPTLEDTGCTTYGLTVTITDDQGCETSEFVTVNAVNVGVVVTTGNGKKAKQEHKVLICHKGKKTISVDYHAVAAHLAHGDCLGSCDDSCGNEGARSVASSDSEETPETPSLILDPTIFPNPAPGKFTVTIGAIEDIVEMQLFNLYGGLVDQAIIDDSTRGVEVEMGSDGLDAGIYMLRIVSGDQIATRKVIVLK